MASDVVYLGGTDKQGNYRIVKVPAGMDLDEAREVVEWALDSPYGRMYPMTWAEVKRLAKQAGKET